MSILCYVFVPFNLNNLSVQSREPTLLKRTWENQAENAGAWITGKHATFSSMQSVKLQRYTITQVITRIGCVFGINLKWKWINLGNQ